MKTIFFYILAVLSRRITIGSEKTFTFFENVKAEQLFKFIYYCHGQFEVTLTNPAGVEIAKCVDRRANIYTKMGVDGLIKINIVNYSNEDLSFSYKCPDIETESAKGYGRIKQLDVIDDLRRILDEYITGQGRLVARVREHKAMVEKTGFLANVIIGFEILVTVIVLWLLHKDFIAMFEKKQKL